MYCFGVEDMLCLINICY